MYKSWPCTKVLGKQEKKNREVLYSVATREFLIKTKQAQKSNLYIAVGSEANGSCHPIHICLAREVTQPQVLQGSPASQSTGGSARASSKVSSPAEEPAGWVPRQGRADICPTSAREEHSARGLQHQLS